MPVATMTFNLPDEATEFRASLVGLDALIVLEQIDQWARSQLKHCEPSKAEVRLLEELRRMIPHEQLEILH
jgi:hypothetical protein